MNAILIQKFINEVNMELLPYACVEEKGFYIDQSEPKYELCFQITFKGNKYFPSAILNVSDKYIGLIRRKMKRFFKSEEVHFNNDWTVFWAFLEKKNRK